MLPLLLEDLTVETQDKTFRVGVLLNGLSLHWIRIGKNRSLPRHNSLYQGSRSDVRCNLLQPVDTAVSGGNSLREHTKNVRTLLGEIWVPSSKPALSFPSWLSGKLLVLRVWCKWKS